VALALFSFLVLYQRPWRANSTIELSLKTFPLEHDCGDEIKEGKAKKA
jgi:hypothetical protein